MGLSKCKSNAELRTVCRSHECLGLGPCGRALESRGGGGGGCMHFPQNPVPDPASHPITARPPSAVLPYTHCSRAPNHCPAPIQCPKPPRIAWPPHQRSSLLLRAMGTHYLVQSGRTPGRTSLWPTILRGLHKKVSGRTWVLRRWRVVGGVAAEREPVPHSGPV